MAQAVGIHGNLKISGQHNLDGTTILADLLEIPDPPRLCLFTKADDCEREVGEPFARQIQSPR